MDTQTLANNNIIILIDGDNINCANCKNIYDIAREKGVIIASKLYGDFSKGVNLHSVLTNYHDGAHLYLCGPRGLMDTAVAAAEAGSWPKESIHREYFSGQPAEESWPPNEEFEISLSRHKKTLTVPTDKSILEIVREAGVSADASCQEGYCTTCRTTLLYGQPEHRDSVLTNEEKAENKTIMICVSRAKAGEHLILDL